MPFSGEFASKISHFDIMKNLDIIEFLESCPDIPKPDSKSIEELIKKDSCVSYFHNCKNATIPNYILSLDGSCYEVTADKNFPSRKLGYIKISLVFLDITEYDLISKNTKKYINPMHVAKLEDDISYLSFALPGAYVQEKGDSSPFESFRKRLTMTFMNKQHQLGNLKLIDTLFHLSLKIEKARIQSDGSKVFVLDKCPNKNCGAQDEFLVDIDCGFCLCHHCGNKIFATDVLRIHEKFSNIGSNNETYSRTMNALEHIVLFHYLNYIYNNDIEFLSKLAVVIDGPLAIYGEAAKYHRAIMQSYHEMKQYCIDNGYTQPIIIGLVKSGRVVEHFMSIKHKLPQKLIFPINDRYRYEFINEQDDFGNKNFGSETYYGQDFLVKSSDGRQFVFCVSYPFFNKTNNFHKEKIKMCYYTNFDSILKFETDMYENGFIPIILAHKHASISLKPGGKMLDILSQKYFKN